MYRKLIGAWMSLYMMREKENCYTLYIIAKCVVDKIILLKLRCNKGN